MTTAHNEHNELALGCFGAASVFDADYHVCQTCAARNACGEQATRNLQHLRSQIDLSGILVRHGRQRGVTPRRASTPVVHAPSPTSAAEPSQTTDIGAVDQKIIDLIGQQNSKAGEQARTLCKHNKINQCRAQLPQRVNPFAQSGPSFMRVACDLLLNGGFTKATLKERLMSALGWSKGTAATHVAMTAVLLYAFGIVTLEDDTFVLHPALTPGPVQ